MEEILLPRQQKKLQRIVCCVVKLNDFSLQEVFLPNLSRHFKIQCSSKHNICPLNKRGGGEHKNPQEILHRSHSSTYLTTTAESLSHQTQRVRTGFLAKQGSRRNPNCGNWHKDFGLSTCVTKWFYVTVAESMEGVTTDVVTCTDRTPNSDYCQCTYIFLFFLKKKKPTPNWVCQHRHHRKLVLLLILPTWNPE